MNQYIYSHNQIILQQRVAGGPVTFTYTVPPQCELTLGALSGVWLSDFSDASANINIAVNGDHVLDQDFGASNVPTFQGLFVGPIPVENGGTVAVEVTVINPSALSFVLWGEVIGSIPG